MRRIKLLVKLMTPMELLSVRGVGAYLLDEESRSEP